MNQYLLHHLLEESAQKYTERNAVVCQDRSMTYGELNHKSSQISSILKSMGVSIGDRVGIYMTKSVESIVFVFGTLKAGAAYVPIDTNSPQSRLEYIVNNCDIRIIFASVDRAEKLIPLLGERTSLSKVIVSGGDSWITKGLYTDNSIIHVDELYNKGEDNPKQLDFSDTNPAYILHTSGSTGMPKGVGLSHLNSMTFVNMAADFFHIKKEDRLACHAPLQFDLSVFDIFVALKKGASVILVPENLGIFPVKLAQFIEEENITVWNSVASVLSLLAEHGRLDRFKYSSLHTVIFSGDVLPVKYLRKLKTIIPKIQFFNVYGQTEANSSTVYHITEIPDNEGWSIPIGNSFPNFEVFAIGENGGLIEQPGQIGELFVRSSSVAVGYWGDEGKTSECFVTDPRSSLPNRKVYRTGDLVTLDKESNYIFLGRKDQQVKSRGYRIQLNEIETVLNNHPAIKEAVVVAIPDELLGNKLISHVSTIKGIEISEIEILSYSNNVLPAYMLPEKIIFHENLPKTPTGKTDRKTLRESAYSK